MSAEQPRLRIALPDAMATAPVRRVMAVLAEGGASARFVGGCVRDTLLGRGLRDIDIATDAEPPRVMALLRDAGIRVVPTGIDHGTVTAILDHQPFEITTLRRDVETDGRRAVVAFTTDWREDAARRDFTMNALSLASDGALFDYFGGVEDARAGHVRFVGDAEQRIREDVLRLLRFFRFHAHYGRGKPDPAGVEICARLAPLLPGLSAERVRAELLRLLEAADPVPTWRLMIARGVLAPLLPEARRLDRLASVVGRAPADALLRLAALVEGGRDAALAVAERLRLSNAERDRLVLLCAPPLAVTAAMGERPLRRALYALGPEAVRDLLVLAGPAAPEAEAAARAVLAGWRPVTLPVAGRDLLERGIPAGPALGRLLKEIEAWWADEDFRPDRAACLAEIARRRGS